MPEFWELFYPSMYKMGDKTDCIDYLGMLLLSTAYKILSNILLSRLTPCAANKIIGSISVNFNIKDELLLKHCQFIKYFRKQLLYNGVIQLLTTLRMSLNSMGRRW